jgi:hypothetical protein
MSQNLAPPARMPHHLNKNGIELRADLTLGVLAPFIPDRNAYHIYC